MKKLGSWENHSKSGIRPAISLAVSGTKPSNFISENTFIGQPTLCRFVVDTGSQRTVISSDLARQIGIHNGRLVEVVTASREAYLARESCLCIYWPNDWIVVPCWIFHSSRLNTENLLGMEGILGDRELRISKKHVQLWQEDAQTY